MTQTPALSYQDRVHEFARQIVWLSHHPERISAEAREIARDIRRRADELGRQENLRAVSGEAFSEFYRHGGKSRIAPANVENVVVFPESKR
jgi:vacuolar-type H+-ATPase catalytic subunit A/Vma1